jgi:hypothetical protein
MPSSRSVARPDNCLNARRDKRRKRNAKDTAMALLVYDAGRIRCYGKQERERSKVLNESPLTDKLATAQSDIAEVAPVITACSIDGHGQVYRYAASFRRKTEEPAKDRVDPSGSMSDIHSSFRLQGVTVRVD